MERVQELACQNAVVIFSKSSCCMCHTIKSLIRGLGVNPAICELDEDPRGRDMEKALIRLLGRNPPIPAVYVGRQLIGSNQEVMALHLNGTLMRLLREAGAIWL